MALILTLVVSFVSAFIPVINAEAYLAAVALSNPTVPATALALVGALGQMGGKHIWYLGAANATRWEWLRKRLEDPKRQVAYEKWRAQLEGRPVLAGTILFLSASVGIPPLAITPIIAGHLRMNVWAFLAIGFVGRWIRFALLLAGVALLPWW